MLKSITIWVTYAGNNQFLYYNWAQQTKCWLHVYQLNLVTVWNSSPTTYIQKCKDTSLRTVQVTYFRTIVAPPEIINVHNCKKAMYYPWWFLPLESTNQLSGLQTMVGWYLNNWPTFSSANGAAPVADATVALQTAQTLSSCSCSRCYKWLLNSGHSRLQHQQAVDATSRCFKNIN